MAELRNFPFMDQLHAPTSDGRPDENAHMNCLCTCIASSLQWLTGRKYNPDQVKDAVYGEAYTGGTCAAMDVVWVAKQGVRLLPISGNSAYLVEQAHLHLAQGHPVIGTIPSTYLPPKNPMDPGMSHCIVFYKDSPGALIAMNPWQAFSQANTDEWWRDRFCYGQLWTLEKVESKTVPLPHGWKDDGKELTAPNGHKVSMGFRNYVLALPWHPDNCPLEDAHAEGTGTEQLFTATKLAWDPKRGVYEVPLGLLVSSLEMAAQVASKQAADLTAQVAQLAEEGKKLSALNEQLNSELDQKDAAPPLDLKAQVQDAFMKFLATL